MPFIEEYIERTVDAIEEGVRSDGLSLPLHGWQAAEQVLRADGVHLSARKHANLYRQAADMAEAGEVMLPEKLMKKGLCEFIGEAAKQQMGPRYGDLLQMRLGPVTSGLE